MSRYFDLLDSVDAAVFSGEILHTDLPEFKEHVQRWSRAIKEQEEINKQEEEENSSEEE